MPNTHIGSDLRLSKFCIPIDYANTKALFHYDISAEDINGIRPYGADIDDSCVAYYDFQPGSNAGILYDRSGRGNNGIIKGASSTNGRNGRALSFDGVDDYVEAMPIAIEQNMTWEVWVKSSTTAKDQFIIDQRDSNGVGVQPIYIQSTGLIQFYDSVTDSLNTAVDVFKFDGGWHHIVCVGTSSSKVVYYDGTNVGSAATGITAKTPITMRIGTRFTLASFTNSTISKIIIYNRALSQDEISKHYKESIYTLRKGEGKYGGCIAIEEGTTNINSDPFFTSGISGWNQNNFTNMEWLQQQHNPLSNTNGVLRLYDNSDIGFCSKAVGAIANTAHTVNVLMKILKGSINNICVGGTVFYTDSTYTDYTWNQQNTKRTPAPWYGDNVYLLTAAITPNSAKTISYYQLRISRINGSDAETELHIYGVQLEAKTFPTSFVNGSRVHGSVTYLPNIMDLSEGTISCWFNPSPGFFSQESWNRIIGHSTAGNVNEIELMRSNSTNKVCFMVSNSAGNPAGSWNIVSSTTALVANTWYHLSATWSKAAGTLKIYVNGIKENQLTGITADKFPSVYGDIGVGYHQNYGRRANGLIDELRIDKVARTDEEILGWYVSQSPFYPRGGQRIIL
jgi:hypothetical protein